MSAMIRLTLFVHVFTACGLGVMSLGCQEQAHGTAGSTLSSAPWLGQVQSAMRVCANGATIEGIDVSIWQDVINWDALVGSDVRYAIMRTSYGTGTLDRQFERNWAESERVGMIRGVYHFFRANQDVEEQARIMLDRMGPMVPGMLPPTIDIETDEDQAPAIVRQKVLEWIDIVQTATGVRPMIYTRANVWDPLVGSVNYGEYPLWVAHYGTECPAIPQGWDTWTFHQYTDEGRADGIDGPVDRNRFNGSMEDLELLAGLSGGCGDGFCGPSENAASCAEDCERCPALPAAGGYVSEESDCFRPGGPPEYWRDDASGYDGHLLWTHTTDNASPANFAEWSIHVSSEADYELEAHIDGPWVKSRQADYLIQTAEGERSVRVDQEEADGWVTVGRFRFGPEQIYTVTLNDNTGEPNGTMTKLIADDIRLRRIPTPDAAMGMNAPTDAGGGAIDADDVQPLDAAMVDLNQTADGGVIEPEQDLAPGSGMLLTPGMDAAAARGSGGCSTPVRPTPGSGWLSLLLGAALVGFRRLCLLRRLRA